MRQKGPIVGVAAVVLVVLIAQFALAGPSQPEDAITITRAELKQLIRSEVAKQTAATSAKKKGRKRGAQGPAGPPGATGPQGPQGPQGAAGTSPACQGNGSGDSMVDAGAACIDRYEASVWSSPTGGTQYGVGSDDYPCNDNGQDCKAGTAGEIYARSVPGVAPSTFITWFQAQQALANVGKRLPTNAEWQQTAAGTPDSTACNVGTGVIANTGANPSCISNFGANDMVGNAAEWVEDWVPATEGCPGWGSFSDDFMCFAGANAAATNPAALHRGGGFNSFASAGPFAVLPQSPASPANSVGFRGTR